MRDVIGARTRRLSRLAVALFAATMAAALLASSAHAAPRGFYGLVPHEEPGAADYNMMQQAKVGSARISLYWQLIERNEGQFDWAATDRQIGQFASRNIQVLPLLNGNPAWLSGSHLRPPIGSALERNGWQQFLREAVKRYGPGGSYWSNEYAVQFPGSAPKPLTTWQIWNEQNGPKHFQPRPNVNRYGNLLRLSSEAIKGEHPGAKILTGGMASKPTGKGGIRAWKFVRKLLKKKSTRKAVDHVALHPYARNTREISSHLKKMRKALKKGKKKKAQVWITEVGWSSKKASARKLSGNAKQQAKRLKSTYKRLGKRRKKWKIGGVYWYTWRDFAGGVCDWCPNAGLVTRNLGLKPAFRKYRKVAR